jgi:hypothetical protein
MRTSFELAHAVNLFAPGLLAKDPLTPLQQKVLGKIADCRTSALGLALQLQQLWRPALSQMSGHKAGVLDR